MTELYSFSAWLDCRTDVLGVLEESEAAEVLRVYSDVQEAIVLVQNDDLGSMHPKGTREAVFRLRNSWGDSLRATDKVKGYVWDTWPSDSFDGDSMAEREWSEAAGRAIVPVMRGER